MFLSPYCAWYPITPIARNDMPTKHFVMRRYVYTSNLVGYAGCLWHNNMKHDPIGLEHIDRYDDFICDEYFASEERLHRKIMNLNGNVRFIDPNVFYVNINGKEMCILITPIDDVKCKVFIFLNHEKNIDSIFLKKMIKYNIRSMIEK